MSLRANPSHRRKVAVSKKRKANALSRAITVLETGEAQRSVCEGLQGIISQIRGVAEDLSSLVWLQQRNVNAKLLKPCPMFLQNTFRNRRRHHMQSTCTASKQSMQRDPSTNNVDQQMNIMARIHRGVLFETSQILQEDQLKSVVVPLESRTCLPRRWRAALGRFPLPRNGKEFGREELAQLGPTNRSKIIDLYIQLGYCPVKRRAVFELLKQRQNNQPVCQTWNERGRPRGFDPVHMKEWAIAETTGGNSIGYKEVESYLAGQRKEKREARIGTAWAIQAESFVRRTCYDFPFVGGSYHYMQEGNKEDSNSDNG